MTRTMTSVQELNDSFDELEKTAMRIKAERDALLEACKFAFLQLDDHYDVDQDGERTREIPFNGAGEVMRALRAAIDKTESR